MRQFIVVISMTVLCCVVEAQYTYFNSLSLEEGLEFGYYDTGTNVEVVGDEIIVWGGKAIEGVPYQFVRRYDNEGSVIEEQVLNFGDTLVYIGASVSFKRIADTDEFLFVHAMISDSTQGLIIKFDENLDTLWTRIYNDYAPETYFYTHSKTDNGYVIAGENGPEPGERGTFIMEIDTLGNVLWHNEIHAPEEGLYRNLDISSIEGGFIVSGFDQGNNGEGYIEHINNQGELEFQALAPAGGVSRGFMLHLVNSENEVIVCHPRAEMESGLSTLTYNSLFLSKLNLESEVLEIQDQHFENEEWLSGAPIKIIEVEDGYALAGRFRTTESPFFNRKAWIMKIDDDFQQEWYTELSYDDEPGNAHYPYDMEQTSDGGYVLVGAYRNSADFYDRTWLVKVDACGDLEWQGCPPVGLGEWEHQKGFNIYPNPMLDKLNIESQTNQVWDEIQITDILGQEVKREVIFNSTVDVSELKTGLYVLILYSKGLPIHSQKILKQ